jgi:hypothetical protein
MLHRLFNLRVAVAVLVLLFTDSPLARGAQRPAATPEDPGAAKSAPSQLLVTSEQDARETRNDFENVLKRLPPAVGRVMRLDPSLMRNASYLAPYPTLATFLQSHPAVVQNPGYYLEHIDYEFWNPREPENARTQAVRAWREMMQGFAILVVFSTVTLALLWIVKTLIDHRRWYRTSKVQTEVHTKLLDRFSSNEDLMAYMQTPSGRRFLESAPLPIEGPTRAMAAPLSRILWSLQAGLVLATGAVGVLFVSGRVIEEIAQPLFALGVLVLALGVGFIVSAGASFLLSRRLGLLDVPVAPREHTGATGA